MKIELINQSNYTKIYCLYDDMGKPLGTKEVFLAGKVMDVQYYSLTSLARSQIRVLFMELESGETEPKPKYQAIMNSSLYHCGYRWVVVDENLNRISEHSQRELAEEEAKRLNDLEERHD